MKVGVLGGGRMGAGIAHAFIMAGCAAVVVERDGAAADAARRRIDDGLARAAQHGTTPPDDARAAVHVGTDVAVFAGADLVIEAVTEDRVLKAAALARIARAAPDAVIATNTSSISIDRLADAVPHRGRFLGMHFFNPVPTSALVEVVTGSATSRAVVQRVQGWVGMLGRTPIVVRDSPGFASSRLGLALALEAIRMLDAGVASAEDIDRAMELGYRHPMGPLRTTDIVGLDVRLGIAEELHTTLGDRFAPPALLRRMVGEGKLGRKSGEGFYRWENA